MNSNANKNPFSGSIQIILQDRATPNLCQFRYVFLAEFDFNWNVTDRIRTAVILALERGRI